jgi:SAM-dependent methyltransferase
VVLEAEAHHMQRILPDLFGYYLVQVGRLHTADLLSRSRVLNRVLIEIDGANEHPPDYPWLRGAAHSLPVASDSVDVVVMPHVLEFDARPHDTVREAQRVLVPEGHLVVSGFSPWSLMGLWRAAHRSRAGMPWCGHFLSIHRVRDWLAVLGFDVVDVEAFFFRPPFRSERLMEKLRRMETAGRRAWWYFAGAYILVARKRVSTLTPIKPSWKRRRRLVSVTVAEPSARVSEMD